MPALAELEAAWLAARADPTSAPSSRALLRDYGGRPTPLYRAARLSEAAGRPVWLKREDLIHTGAHKINNALGQACSPSGWASRGSSPRPAPASTASPPRPRARCSASSASSTWAPRTSAASSPTCSAWGCSARRVAPRRGRRADAQGGRQRGDPRLGRQRRRHPLHHRLGRRPGAVPGARARPAARDRRRGARADPRARRPAARARRSRASAAARTRSASSPRSSTTPSVELVGVEAAGEGLDTRPPRRAADRRRSRRRPARLLLGDHAGRGRPDRSRRTRSPPGSTTRARARSTRGCATPAAPATWRSPTTQALAAFRALAELEGIIPALESVARARLGARRTRPRGDGSTSSASPAAATRTSPRSWRGAA